nr:MAG TPA: hypothetical protein [Caudoviricetes sp.]
MIINKYQHGQSCYYYNLALRQYIHNLDAA